MTVPKILSVKPLHGKYLLVTFDNGVQKIYDCSKLFNLARFQLLKQKAFFNAITVESGGYGVSWNDEMDLSEYELWTNGVNIDQGTDKNEELPASPQLTRG